jgi:hypothetical protein
MQLLVNQRGATIGGGRPQEYPIGRCIARAIGAEQANNGAPLNYEAYVVYSCAIGKRLSKMAGFLYRW